MRHPARATPKPSIASLRKCAAAKLGSCSADLDEEAAHQQDRPDLQQPSYGAPLRYRSLHAVRTVLPHVSWKQWDVGQSRTGLASKVTAHGWAVESAPWRKNAAAHP